MFISLSLAMRSKDVSQNISYRWVLVLTRLDLLYLAKWLWSEQKRRKKEKEFTSVEYKIWSQSYRLWTLEAANINVDPSKVSRAKRYFVVETTLVLDIRASTTTRSTSCASTGTNVLMVLRRMQFPFPGIGWLSDSCKYRSSIAWLFNSSLQTSLKNPVFHMNPVCINLWNQ